MRAIEFFSGIGGWRYAAAGRLAIAAAFDINAHANATYAHNHGQRPLTREIAGLTDGDILKLAADTWLMSPPCQPFCRLGHNQGLRDRRSRGLARLTALIERHPPRRLVLENVVGFEGSDAHQRLLAALAAHGYHVSERHLCPTELGLPNRRPRYYLVAADGPLVALPPLAAPAAPAAVAGFLDPVEDPALFVPADDLARHWPGLDLAAPEDSRTACFIGGYGQRYVRSGSFLRTPRGVRRFSPSEIARLHGLPPSFSFPPGIPLAQQYQLLGNSLNAAAAAWILNQLPRDG